MTSQAYCLNKDFLSVSLFYHTGHLLAPYDSNKIKLKQCIRNNNNIVDEKNLKVNLFLVIKNLTVLFFIGHCVRFPFLNFTLLFWTTQLLFYSTYLEKESTYNADLVF